MDFTLTKEQRDIQKAAREFAAGRVSRKRPRSSTGTRPLTPVSGSKACELGFVGVFIDETYGGAGLGFLEHCLITEEFWAVDAGMGNAVITSTFGSELLQLFGTEEQKQKYLPPLVQGEAVIGTAITEPDAGSDVTMATTTRRAGQGRVCDQRVQDVHHQWDPRELPECVLSHRSGEPGQAPETFLLYRGDGQHPGTRPTSSTGSWASGPTTRRRSPSPM